MPKQEETKELIKKEDNKPIKLNPKQEMFCKLFASDKEFFGNGAQSYMEAYDKVISYKAARACASRLLTNANILKRINQLLEVYVNHQVVDKNLAFVIIQNADFSSKVAAIKEYNRLKQRVTKKLDLTSGGFPLIKPSQEEMDRATKAIEQMYD